MPLCCLPAVITMAMAMGAAAFTSPPVFARPRLQEVLHTNTSCPPGFKAGLRLRQLLVFGFLQTASLSSLSWDVNYIVLVLHEHGFVYRCCLGALKACGHCGCAPADACDACKGCWVVKLIDQKSFFNEFLLGNHAFSRPDLGTKR